MRRPRRTVAARPLVGVELDRRAEGVLHAGHPGGVQLGGHRGQHRQPLVHRRLGQQPGHQALRAFLQHAGGLTGARIADDRAVHRIRRVAGDPGQRQRLRVDPGGVVVEAADEGRPIGHRGIELRPRRQSAGEGVVAPALAEHPRPRRLGRGELPQPGLHLRHRVGVTDVGALGGEAAFEQVQVGVVEAGHDAAAPRVEGGGRRPAQPLEIGGAAHGDDPIAAHGHRFVQRGRAVGGIDPGVGHQQIRRGLGRRAAAASDHDQQQRDVTRLCHGDIA